MDNADWEELDIFTKRHTFEKDAENNDNPAFLWASDALCNAEEELAAEKLLMLAVVNAMVERLTEKEAQIEDLEADKAEAENTIQTLRQIIYNEVAQDYGDIEL